MVTYCLVGGVMCVLTSEQEKIVKLRARKEAERRPVGRVVPESSQIKVAPPVPSC